MFNSNSSGQHLKRHPLGIPQQSHCRILTAIPRHPLRSYRSQTTCLLTLAFTLAFSTAHQTMERFLLSRRQQQRWILPLNLNSRYLTALSTTLTCRCSVPLLTSSSILLTHLIARKLLQLPSKTLRNFSFPAKSLSRPTQIQLLLLLFTHSDLLSQQLTLHLPTRKTCQGRIEDQSRNQKSWEKQTKTPINFIDKA